ncbi:MAG: hypothetical protein GX915_05475 [Clostridiales bacterium]|nr:hypothetical protein [Clostridiales bacterium]
MKKLLSLLIGGVLLATSFSPLSIQALGDTVMAEPMTRISSEDITADPMIDTSSKIVSSSSKEDVSNKALETVILAVKSKIAIPEKYSEFDYNFYNSGYNNEFIWSLIWRDTKESGHIRVEADQNNRIISYNNYTYNQKGNPIPVNRKNEMLGKAEDFLKKINSDVANKLAYKDSYFEGIYSSNYVYSFERFENGISFPDNTVSVGINGATGEVAFANINWLYDTKLPSSKADITKEKATELIKDNMSMKLVYRSDNYRIYDKATSNEKGKAYLVYEPTQNYIAIDAKTGKVYDKRSEWVDQGHYSNQESEKVMDKADNTAGSPVTLTDKEMKKIEELKKLISKEEAINKVLDNKYLYLDKGLKLNYISLEKDNYNNNSDDYVWNINFMDPKEIDYNTERDYYRASASARVDAKTGKILSFYAGLNNYYDEEAGKWKTVKIKYDSEQARGILEKFIKAENSSRFKKSTLVNETPDFIAYYIDNKAIYAGYNYQYNRVNDDVEYPNNNIYGAVEGITGKVYSYGYYWEDDIVFESTKGIINADKAMDSYLSKEGFDLKYEINTVNTEKNNSYETKKNIRLVYRPDINPSGISPFTGEQLDYNGQVYVDRKPYEYKDVPDTEANREILLLADMNIGFEGENFYPYKDITISEITKLLEGVGYGYRYDREVELKGDNYISKEELAYILITELGLEKIAKFSEIYKTGFNDETSINKNYIGAVALAKGLGIVEADGNNNFNPKNNITRRDAVHYILEFLQERKEDIYY